MESTMDLKSEILIQSPDFVAVSMTVNSSYKRLNSWSLRPLQVWYAHKWFQTRFTIIKMRRVRRPWIFSLEGWCLRDHLVDNAFLLVLKQHTENFPSCVWGSWGSWRVCDLLSHSRTLALELALYPHLVTPGPVVYSGLPVYPLRGSLFKHQPTCLTHS